MLTPLVVGFFSALGAGLGAMVFFEARGAAGWASGRLIKFAANRLPTAMRDDRYEEWLAEYEHWKDGAIGRLLWSLGLVLAAIRIARRERLNAVRPERLSDALPEGLSAEWQHRVLQKPRHYTDGPVRFTLSRITVEWEGPQKRLIVEGVRQPNGTYTLTRCDGLVVHQVRPEERLAVAHDLADSLRRTSGIFRPRECWGSGREQGPCKIRYA